MAKKIWKDKALNKVTIEIEGRVEPKMLEDTVGYLIGNMGRDVADSDIISAIEAAEEEWGIKDENWKAVYSRIRKIAKENGHYFADNPNTFVMLDNIEKALSIMKERKV